MSAAVATVALSGRFVSQETKAQTRHLMINKTPVDIFRATEHVGAAPCIFAMVTFSRRGLRERHFANVVCLRELPRYSHISQDIGEALTDFTFRSRATLFRRGYVTDVSPTLMMRPPARCLCRPLTTSRLGRCPTVRMVQQNICFPREPLN